jgi:hypothetical protein
MSWQNPVTWTPGSTPGATEFNLHIRDMFNAVLPVGSLIYRVASATAIETVIENRFLECNGVAVSRTTYATLFNYLNGLTPALAFGVGNGSTTFNLPDFRGRLPVSAAGAGGKALVDVIGDSDGLAQNLRSISHRHAHGQGSGSGAFGGPDNPAAVGFTTGDADNLNNPAFLVAGIWYIKYTS